MAWLSNGVNEEQLRQDMEMGNVKGRIEIISEGGGWVVMRKESQSSALFTSLKGGTFD